MGGNMTSQRNKKINDLIALKPRADVVALARISPADLEDTYDSKGTVTGTKMRSNVFRILRERETITPNQSAAGAKAVEIYAAWKGLGGAPDQEDPGYHDKGRAQPELVTDHMINAGRQWKQIMSYIGPSSARLILALCQDIVEGDGAHRLGQVKVVCVEHVKPAAPGLRPAPVIHVERIEERAPNQSRWRAIVDRVTGEKDRNRQATHVAIACGNLEEFWR